LYLTGYLSRDASNLGTDTTFAYHNVTGSVEWRHTFNPRLFSRLVAGADEYGYKNYADNNPVNAYQLNFAVRQFHSKAEFHFEPNARHQIDFGLNAIYYKMNPGEFVAKGQESLVVPVVLEQEQALETGVYLSDNFTVTSWLSLNAGIRFSAYTFLGPKAVSSYGDGPKDELNTIGETRHSRGELIKNYYGPEYRFSTRFSIMKDLSVKAGFNTQRQYIHMLSNTTALAPTDTWKLSDPHIRPQYGSQLSLGVYKNFRKNTIETSVEVYRKRLTDYLDYKSGAVLLLNPHIETDVINTKGQAYGLELLLKKLSGKVNGWMSYTYSRILLKTDGLDAGELVNGGQEYPANYDKPHSFNLAGNFRFSHRFSMSVNTAYSSGRPITLPVAKYQYGNSERVLYSNRNEYRIPDYFRIDFSMNLEGNHYLKQLTHNSWTIGIYNVTGRKNAYSTYYTSEGGVIKGYKLSIFGAPIPFVNYNIRF
jgi:hypothetical protein